MRKSSIVVFAMACLPAIAFQNPERQLSCHDGGFQVNRLVTHCEMKEQTLAAPKGAIHVDPGVNGGVSVKGWNRSEVLVRARIQTAAETETEARGMVSQIRFASGAGQVQAEGPPQERHRSWSVTYEIFVPRQSDVEAKAHNGGISIADVRGRIEFHALNGGVSLKRLAGEVHGQTTNGGLT